MPRVITLDILKTCEMPDKTKQAFQHDYDLTIGVDVQDAIEVHGEDDVYRFYLDGVKAAATKAVGDALQAKVNPKAAPKRATAVRVADLSDVNIDL